MVKGLEEKLCELRLLGVLSLEETEESPHCCYNFFRRGRGETGTDLSLLTSDTTQGNVLKLCQEMLRLDI